MTGLRAATFLASLAFVAAFSATALHGQMGAGAQGQAQQPPPPTGSTQLPQGAAAGNVRFLQQLQQLRAQQGRPATAGQPQLPAAATPPGSGFSATPASAKPSPGMPLAASAPAIPAVAASRPSLLDQPAVPPTIQLQGDSLTVTASNASLTEVLRQVATRTGMQIEGAQHDERIFGTYGPGRPTEVLSALLYDSGYNLLMAGAAHDGAPARLVLSPRTTAPTGQQNAAVTRSSDEDEDDSGEQAAPPPPMLQRPDAGTVPAQAQNGPRTPQQMLEELQRLRQAQSNGQPQEPPTRDDNGQPQPNNQNP